MGLRRINTEEAREMGKIGGKRSAEARKRNAEIRAILAMPLKEGALDSIEDIQNLSNVNGANLTVEQAMTLAMVRKALKGDVKCYETLMRQESARKAAELSNLKAEREIEKLKNEIEEQRMRHEAYKNAMERAQSSEVTIIDDIPSD